MRKGYLFPFHTRLLNWPVAGGVLKSFTARQGDRQGDRPSRCWLAGRQQVCRCAVSWGEAPSSTEAPASEFPSQVAVTEPGDLLSLSREILAPKPSAQPRGVRPCSSPKRPSPSYSVSVSAGSPSRCIHFRGSRETTRRRSAGLPVLISAPGQLVGHLPWRPQD